jgi:hypothetical protein
MSDIFPARHPVLHPLHPLHPARHPRCPASVITKRDAQTTLRAAFYRMQIYCHSKK